MPAGQCSTSLTKSGVAISVRPDVLLRRTGRDGEPSAGAIKLHFAKTSPLDERAAEYVGVILHEYGELFLSHLGLATYRNFFVIDVFAQRIYSAPRAWVRRRSEVDAACEEIASRWEKI